ncbi:hypothetical protein D3C87_1339060 [compost metagenome]
MGGRSVSQSFPIITRPANSRTGKLQGIEQSNAIHARRRTPKETRRERIVSFLWVLAIALSVGYLFHHIAKGLPYVLTQHGAL